MDHVRLLQWKCGPCLPENKPDRPSVTYFLSNSPVRVLTKICIFPCLLIVELNLEPVYIDVAGLVKATIGSKGILNFK